MATADEEAGGHLGAGWLAKNRPELFEGVGVILNEGGSGAILGTEEVGAAAGGGMISFDVEVTQKVPWWFRLVATDEPGHGSTPRATNAVTRLVPRPGEDRRLRVRAAHRAGRRRVLQGDRARRRRAMA